MTEVKLDDPDVNKANKAFVPLGMFFPCFSNAYLAKHNRKQPGGDDLPRPQARSLAYPRLP